MSELLDEQIKALHWVNDRSGVADSVAVTGLRHLERQVVLTGIGKSGLVAQTVATLWTSVGLRSRYIHPVEALHGDMAFVDDDAVIIALSQSGKTPEVQVFLDHLVVRDGDLHTIVAATTPGSPLALRAAYVMDTTCGEITPMPAPFISTVLQRAWLDAVCFRWLQRFDATALREEYAGNHPGGQIGKDMRT
jgi:arabinose-5-phosphate isomerase